MKVYFYGLLEANIYSFSYHSQIILYFSLLCLSYLFKCKLVEEKNTTIFELEICIVPKMENVAGNEKYILLLSAYSVKKLYCFNILVSSS